MGAQRWESVPKKFIIPASGFRKSLYLPGADGTVRRLHTRDALSAGESSDRISVLPAWRETEYFNAKERAGLALVEAITLIAEGQVPDAVYSEAAKTLSAEEIAAMEWLAIMINTWNRVAIASRYPVK